MADTTPLGIKGVECAKMLLKEAKVREVLLYDDVLSEGKVYANQLSNARIPLADEIRDP